MFKSLLRTLPTLSGNFSICCKLNNYNKITSNDYEVCVRDASILSLQDNQYKNEVSINLAKENYEFIIAKYYNLCSNVFYKENYSYNKDSYQEYDKYEVNSNNDARNKDYEFGCKRLHYSYNGYQFNFYAPFYINDLDSLPEYFLLSIYMTDKLVKNIKIFINKENSNNYLRKFLRKYCNSLDNKVIFCLPESKQATYFGINVKEGGFGQYIDNEFGDLYNTQNTINNFDYIICKGFERNNLIMKQIIPLSFSFNINDLFDDYEKKVFSFDKIKIIGRYYNRFDSQEDFYDFSIDYNTFYGKYNKYTSNGNYELNYGYDKDNNIINVMNIGYPSLNESKFIKYRYTNKITPKYCRFKLANSNEDNPYIINMSYAYSNIEEDNDKYGEFPTMFKDIFPESIVEKNNLLLPIGKKYTDDYIDYDYLNYLKYKKLMTNFYSSWFNIFKEDTNIFDNIYEWSDVVNNYSYFKGILYNFKNEDIDKFTLFISPKLNYLSNNDSKTTIISAAYIYDIKRRDIDFVEMNKLSYDRSYNLENNKGTIDVTADINLDVRPSSYTLSYKFNDEEIFNINSLLDPQYYEERNDNIDYNNIYFNLEGDITYTNKFFSKSYISDYVASNKNVIKDTNGNYIYVNKYFKRNLYYKVKDIIKLIKDNKFDVPEINELMDEYIDHNKILGYELLRINSNNNIYDSEGNIVFENLGTNDDITINDLYVILKGSSEKVKLLSIIDKIKNNKTYYQSLSIFKSCELLEKESLFNFLYKSLKIKNIKYSNNEKDIDSYIKILYNINMNILNDYIFNYFNESEDIPYETVKNIILDIVDKFYPYYEVTYTNEEIIEEYLYEYDKNVQFYYSVWIKNLLNDYNYLASLLKENIEYLQHGDNNVKHNLKLYNTEKSYSLLAFLYNDLVNNITSYNYVPYSINANKDVINDYYIKNESYTDNSIYVDSFNLNSLIYQYNCQYNYTKQNKQFIDFIEDNSRIYNIEEKYGEFLNLDHIKEYVKLLYNDENYKWNNLSKIDNKTTYISVINNIYVKERVWIIENNELIYKDKYTILSEYLKNINTNAYKYKYVNDILIVNTVYGKGINNEHSSYEDVNCETGSNEDPIYNEQYYKYANEIFYNIMCSSVKNENNRFVIKLDKETSIELTLVFKKKFVKLNNNLLKILEDGYYMYLYNVNYDSLNNDNWNYERNTDNLEPIENFISPLFKNIYMNDYDVDSIHNMIFKNKIINNEYSNNNQNVFMYIDIYTYFKDYLIKNSINKKNYDKFIFVNKYIDNDIIINQIFNIAKSEWNTYVEDYNNNNENKINFNIDTIERLFNRLINMFIDKYTKRIQINEDFTKELTIIFTDAEYNDEIFKPNELNYSDKNKYNIDKKEYNEKRSILLSIYNSVNSIINSEIGDKNNKMFKNFFDYKYIIGEDINGNKIYGETFFKRIFIYETYNDNFIKNVINTYINTIPESYYREEIINNYIGIDLYSIYNTNNITYSKNVSYDNTKYELIKTNSNLNILLDKYSGKKYGFFIIDFEFDNTNNSLNISNQYNVTSSFETINGKSLNYNYIIEIFKSINPFFKENIFKNFTLYNSDYVIFPNELNIDIIYNSIKLNKDEEYKYTMLKESDSDKLYENIIKLNKSKKMKLLRYFCFIDPLITKTNIINNLWEMKFIETNDYSNKYNILYKSNVNINQYNGIYLCNDYDVIKHVENRHNIINQYEYKHYNDNSFYNLNETIIITIDKLVEYNDIINIYQTPERTYEEFKKYINKINKNIDDLNIILFLFNKYTVSYSSEQIKLDSTKSKKLYKISYKFNLK